MMDEYYYKKFEPFFGKWRVSKKIGEGAFGKVYEIYWDDDLGTHNRSALKLIHIPTDEALRQHPPPCRTLDLDLVLFCVA